MDNILDHYKILLGAEVIDQLHQIASILKGIKVVHVNSTREGGGVAEILSEMIPLTNALGLDSHWEVIKGNNDFFQCTKMFHNLLQGRGRLLPGTALIQNYEETVAENARLLAPQLNDADIV